MQDERQLILADQNFRDIRPVMGAEIDMAIGSDENDYEIKIRRDQWDDRYKYGNVFYINDTEYYREEEDKHDRQHNIFIWQDVERNVGKENHSSTRRAGL